MAIRRIPSLNWLRVFETAARTQSFARAAQELAMSPPAVSQQIKALESHLKTPLFQRGPRSVALTRAGHAFLPAVQQALRSVETTAASLFGDPGGQPLSIQASLMFACAWLAPRLPDFQARHPRVVLNLMTEDESDEGPPLGTDLQIAFGTGPGRGLEEDLLFGEVLYPVALPVLAAQIQRPDDLLDHWLIEIASHRSGWLQVLEPASDLDLGRARFCFADTTQLSLAMAAGGYGVALARAPATDQLLESHGLVPCLDGLETRGSQSYHLIYPAKAALSPAARGFRSWLLDETGLYR